MTLIWLRPLWALALLPLALAGWRIWTRGGFGGWERVLAPAVLARLGQMGLARRDGGRLSRILPVLAAAGIAVALTGPARLTRAADGFLRGDPILLMLDLSPSVTGTPARIEDLRAAAAALLQGAEGRPVGVLVFAADAFVASAPTVDAASLESLVGVLDAQTMPLGGSRPDIALGAVRELFGAGAAIGGADLVMISDGGGAGTPAALAEARRMAEGGARLWTLALTAAPAAPEMPPADAAALARLAEAGGGGTAPAGAAPDLAARMAARQIGGLAASEHAPEVFRDLGRWLLLLALAPAALMFRRRPA
ncbi:VWA domain-containing protein [Frigidibacter sp. MR17.24]|uniref:VWA domain-containing protein n=1 Tax=Frigidibacter sp. MR17.24 TaxID=3127345 RepID=UPI0030131C2C